MLKEWEQSKTFAEFDRNKDELLNEAVAHE